MELNTEKCRHRTFREFVANNLFDHLTIVEEEVQASAFFTSLCLLYFNKSLAKTKNSPGYRDVFLYIYLQDSSVAFQSASLYDHQCDVTVESHLYHLPTWCAVVSLFLALVAFLL